MMGGGSGAICPGPLPFLGQLPGTASWHNFLAQLRGGLADSRAGVRNWYTIYQRLKYSFGIPLCNCRNTPLQQQST
jgi:hypothetical protein